LFSLQSQEGIEIHTGVSKIFLSQFIKTQDHELSTRPSFWWL